ncbi:MAG: bifunctional phosphoribosylaminoimidazolecarboxamide formyltransferase/IMP cyclohydrolase PurH, partial [Bacteroidota bacterium]
AFTRIAEYDIAIAEKLGSVDTKFVTLKSGETLRYGENPQQPAQVFEWQNAQGPTLKSAQVLQGKELSYNNMLDADAAWKAASDASHLFENQGCVAVVVKHGNPCGYVHAHDTLTALERAWAGDSVSSFGGIVALTQAVDEKVAGFFQDKFLEIILAPHFTAEAQRLLSSKKNVRLMQLPLLPLKKNEQVLRSFNGGVLWQMEDESLQTELKAVTTKKFTLADHTTALFGVLAAKHLKSNAIALVTSDGAITELVGAGMGQPNRLDSLLRLALPRAEEKDFMIEDVIMVSDAFFPFPDTVEEAAKAGITKIVQPGGSIKDSEVFAAADRLGIAMVTTGERHFRH